MVEERVKDATKILNLLRSMSGYKPHFEVIGNYRLIDDGIQPEATVIIKANGKEMHEADTGVGPVDALAKVLKKSLKSIFPHPHPLPLRLCRNPILMVAAGPAAGACVQLIDFIETARNLKVATTNYDTVSLWERESLPAGRQG